FRRGSLGGKERGGLPRTLEERYGGGGPEGAAGHRGGGCCSGASGCAGVLWEKLVPLPVLRWLGGAQFRYGRIGQGRSRCAVRAGGLPWGQQRGALDQWSFSAQRQRAFALGQAP